MASFKEPHTARPMSQSRPAAGTTPSLNVPHRHATSRNHAHSVSLGTINPTHRVTRRKSMTSNAASNLAAVAAAIRGYDEASLEALTSPDNRLAAARPSSSRAGDAYVPTDQPTSVNVNHYLADDNQGTNARNTHPEDVREENAVIDGHSTSDHSESMAKARARRASEGAYLTKIEGKRVSGELRCEKCGKGYKHSSCLTKHLWEHTPEWNYTSKLLISKHQQVQLLEAASVLVNMNLDLPLPTESTKANDSDHSSASPAAFASSSSDLEEDDTSSTETTPPPTNEQADFTSYDGVRSEKRYSNTSSMFSRSYQSVPTASVAASSVPTAASYGSFHHLAYRRRPSTSGATTGPGASEEEAALAAAVELCHFTGTPRTGPVQMDDIPPVPPLPARYASHNVNRSVSGVEYPGILDLGVPPPLTHRLSDERGSKMDVSQSRAVDEDDEYYDQRSVSRGRSDEDDDGVFGRMEE